MRDSLFSWLEKSRRSNTPFIVALIILALYVPFKTVGAVAPTVFEITNANKRGPVYGGTGGTNLLRIAQRYIPPENQVVCSVSHAVRQDVGRGGGIVFKVVQGGGNPDVGTVVARVEVLTIPASFAGSEVAFVLPECVTLSSGLVYWFMFEPRVYQTFGGSHSFYAVENQHAHTSYWQYEGFAAVGGAAWREYTGREWSLRLFGPEPPLRKVPVVIVPGILGSKLNRVSDGEEVWPNGPKMSTPFLKDTYLNELILDIFGEATTISKMVAPTILDSAFGKNVYGGLLQTFVDAGYASGTELFIAPYDWRLSVASSSERLAEVVARARAESPNGKVSIVAHSMGGVVTKQFLQSTTTDFIDKLVLAGVPQLGSPKAFKALTYGDNFGFALGPIDVFNVERSKIISQNMPGVYELLPSRAYVDGGRSYLYDATREEKKLLDFEGARDFMLRDPDDSRNAHLFDKADAIHSALDHAGFGIATSSLYTVVGCQNPATIGVMRVYPDDEFDIASIDGDGTVPLASATYGTLGTTYYVLHGKTRIDHMGLVGDTRTLTLIRDIISGVTSTPADGITTDVERCQVSPSVAANETTLAFSTHSPVLLHIYDDQGRHVGPTPEGNIELGIPGSSYEIIKDNSFAWVPGGGIYRVSIDATNAGAFTVKIKEMQGPTVARQTAFIEVPLESDATTASLHVSSDGQVSNLLLDENGDGIEESSFAPNAVLTGAQAEDRDPPLITFENIEEGTEFIHSALFSPRVSVIDGLSGVATSSAELDGRLITEGAVFDLFDFSFGNHVLVVTAQDNVGNAATAMRTIKVVATKESFKSDVQRMRGLEWIHESLVSGILEEIDQLTAEGVSEFLLRIEDYRQRCYLNERAYEMIKNNLSKIYE